MGIEQLIMVVHIAAAIGIIALILIQQGKGADAGASFGSGASQTVFGSGGSGNFLTKSTAALAALFFATSFGLAIYAKEKAGIDVDAALPSAEVIEAQALDQEIPAVTDEIPTLDASEVPVVDSVTDVIGADADIPAAAEIPTAADTPATGSEVPQ